MKKATKRLVSFLTATAMTMSLFTFAFAASEMTASYDKEDDIVTVENIPNTGDLLNVSIVKGTDALDDAKESDFVGFVQSDYVSEKEITIADKYLVDGDLPDGTYTVHIGGSNGTYKSCTFVVGSIEATYDAETNKVTVSKLSTGVTSQTIQVKSASGTIVGIEEFTGAKIAASQVIPMPADIANGEYTVYVSYGNEPMTCKVTIARAVASSITAEYDEANNKIVVSNIATENVTTQTITIENEKSGIVGIEEYSGSNVADTQEIPVSADITDGEYTVTVSCDGVMSTCTVTVVRTTVLKATYDAATNKVTVKNLETENVTVQTIQIKSASGTIVGIEEFTGGKIATSQVIPMPTNVANGEYTVYVSYGDKVLDCKVTVARETTPTEDPEATPDATATPDPTATPEATPEATPDATNAPKPTPTAKPSNNGGGGSTSIKPTAKPSSGLQGGTAVIITPTVSPDGETTSQFTDMAGYEWANTAVNTLASLGVLDGRSDTIFDPGATVTRAEFTKMVCGAMGLPARTGAVQKFDDVPATHWAYGYIAMAAELGIVEGYTDTEFRPNQLISREQMAAILYRAIVACKNESKLPGGTPISFTDYAQISDYAKASVNALSAAGVIKGVTDTTFVPQATANRAQAASIIYQYFKAIGLVQ